MQDNQNTQDQNQVQKKTEAEFIEQMKNLLQEVNILTEDLKQVKDDAKEAGYDQALLAKVAKALADAKVDDVLEKNDKFQAMVDKYDQATD